MQRGGEECHSNKHLENFVVYVPQFLDHVSNFYHTNYQKVKVCKCFIPFEKFGKITLMS